MYCPDCRSEYEAGITKCEECGVALVEEDPDAGAHEGEGFIQLREITDPDELPLFKSVLDAAGIPYLIQGEETQGLFPLPGVGATLFPPSLGAIIQVPEDRLEEARELLENAAVSTEPDPDPGPEEN